MSSTKQIPGTLAELLREEVQLAADEAYLKNRRQQVEAAKAALNSSSPTHLLAIELHSKLCRWNHTDGCGWYYAVKQGQHDWSEHAHREYLQRAAKIMSRLACETVTQENVVNFITDCF